MPAYRIRSRQRLFAAAGLLLLTVVSLPAVGQDPPPAPPGVAETAPELGTLLSQLPGLLPASAAGYETFDPEQLLLLASQIEAAAAFTGEFAEAEAPADLLPPLREILQAQQVTDEALEELLAQRGTFASLPEGESQRQALRNFLQTADLLIALSGHLRYQLRDAVDTVGILTVDDAPLYEQLLDLLIEYKSGIGATMTAPVLFSPLTAALQQEIQGALVTPTIKRKQLELIAVSGEQELLQQVVAFMRNPAMTTPALTLAAAETIRAVGLPQPPRPGSDETLPPPEITPAQLQQLLAEIPTANLTGAEYQQRAELLRWVKHRRQHGVTEESYRVGRLDVRPGDWLLMRNPSPYNLFTDLSPGLFTHVGVVTAEVGSDGIRRFVIVDLPERGTEMPATNVEIFLHRTLNYMFLRHDDPQVAEAMAGAAADVIGNPTEFDLNFRTSRVDDLKDQPLKGAKINTYCAGLLLLCAQTTAAPRTDFFPIAEFPAPGNTISNIGKLGLSIGDNFVSPTGALFSPRLQLVGRRAPMYDPRREVEQAIYDDFASRLEAETLVPSNSLSQSLQIRVAQAASSNSLLSRAMARAAGVGEGTDLVAAARAKAVVDTLDEIAYGASGQFLAAREALTSGPVEELRAAGLTSDELRAVEQYRAQHSDLFRQWANNQLTPRELRIQLVDHYIQAGRNQLNDRFFSGK